MKRAHQWLVLWLVAASAPGAVTWPAVTLTGYQSQNAFSRPVYLTHAGDGSGRIFVVEQAGRIKIIQPNGSIVATPFLNITNRIFGLGNPSDEKGLLGLAFPPGYASKRYFYVYYHWFTGAASTNHETRVSRFFLTGDDNIADANSEQIVYRKPQPRTNHNGGQIMFGPDGYLYVCSGDGGHSWDENPPGEVGHFPIGNGQTLYSPLGKILRIDVESAPVTNSWQIPPTNPFLADTNALPEIWAYGLRNPYRCSFDRLTGDLFIADVGQNANEEIDFQPAGDPGGQNYGWRRYEGFTCTARANDPPCGQNTNTLTFPVATYGHTSGRCSIIGGYVHRGSPEWWPIHGTYLYGDFCTGEIFGLKRDGSSWTNRFLQAATALDFTGIGEDEAGNLYVCATNGAIRRIDESASDFVDTDGDKMPNVFEAYYGLNPTNAADAALDKDGDGLSNLDELTAGTSPTNAASRLFVGGLSATATNALVLQWPSVAGRRYGVDAASNLAAAFSVVVTNLPATPPVNAYTITTTEAGGFYQINARTN